MDEDGSSEEEYEEEKTHRHTLKVAIGEPEEGIAVEPCELYPARQSQMSFFLSGLLLITLTMLWLVFI